MQNDILLEEFMEDMELQGRSKGTLREYKQRILVFLNFLEDEHLEVNTVKNENLSGFSKQMLKSGQQVSTLRSKLSTIHVFYEWAVRKGYATEVIIDPKDYPRNVNAKRIKRLTDEDLKTFKSYIDTLQPNIRAAFWTMIGTGCRVGEAAHLRAEDVTLRGKAVYIDIKDAKWHSDRCIPVTDAKAAQILWKYRTEVEVDNRPLFRLSKRTIQGYATQFARSTGITFRCHLLRHTYAGLLTEKGVPLTTIQHLLGHKSLGMTAHYAQSALVDLSGLMPVIGELEGED